MTETRSPVGIIPQKEIVSIVCTNYSNVTIEVIDGIVRVHLKDGP